MKSIGKLLNHHDLWLLLIPFLQLETETSAFLMDGHVCTGDFVDVEGCENNTLPRKFKNGLAGVSDLGSSWALGIDWGVCLAIINITCFGLDSKFPRATELYNFISKKLFIYISLQHVLFCG